MIKEELKLKVIDHVTKYINRMFDITGESDYVEISWCGTTPGDGGSIHNIRFLLSGEETKENKVAHPIGISNILFNVVFAPKSKI